MISFRTVSGRRLDLEQPRPEDVDIRDIACGLSKICRFTGQLPEFYSIAQHSLFVAELVPARLKKAALLHDASEAFLTDISRNLKHSPFMDGYRLLEDRWRAAIEEQYGLALAPADRQELKYADDLAAIYERVTVRKQRTWQYHGLQEIVDASAEGWVRSPRLDLLRLAEGIPEEWPTNLSCRRIEEIYLQKFWEYDRL